MQNRTPEQIVDVPVPQFMEAIVEVAPSPPQESVQNRTPEQIVDVPGASAHGGNRGSCAISATGTRAELHA